MLHDAQFSKYCWSFVCLLVSLFVCFYFAVFFVYVTSLDSPIIAQSFVISDNCLMTKGWVWHVTELFVRDNWFLYAASITNNKQTIVYNDVINIPLATGHTTGLMLLCTRHTSVVQCCVPVTLRMASVNSTTCASFRNNFPIRFNGTVQCWYGGIVLCWYSYPMVQCDGTTVNRALFWLMGILMELSSEIRATKRSDKFQQSNQKGHWLGELQSK